MFGRAWFLTVKGFVLLSGTKSVVLPSLVEILKEIYFIVFQQVKALINKYMHRIAIPLLCKI